MVHVKIPRNLLFFGHWVFAHVVAKQNVNPLSNVTVSFQLFRTQENDSDIDSDFEDFDSDEESDSELVW